ncbi:SDR family oxidoreductase [Amycolatopsis jejuensis]|uniref:SDR family oxidoreductase n=1 Tax=Amycolatopsis jejuensis TaxID=330084 RepID=UPI0005262E1B|nr:SDR family oxidoreductase [Amycolatopsis jejuensis]
MGTESVAVVTGGAGGIGRETARLLASSGRHVVVADLDGDAAEVVASEVGGTAVAVDVGDVRAWSRVDAVLRRLDRPVDAVVLNAGVALGEADLLEVDLAAYRRIWPVNVDGVVFGLRTLVPFLTRSHGHAVVTASLAGLTAVPFDPVYAMTKHALIGLVRSYAPTLAARNVGLHAVCPGLVDTELLGAARSELAELEFPLIAASDVAAALTSCALGTGAGEVVVCQPGRAPVPYRFAGIPGPGQPVAALPSQLPIGRA